MSEARAFFGSQLTGRGCRSARQLRGLYPTRFRSLEKDYHGLPTMLIQLEDDFVNENISSVKGLLQIVARRICEITNINYQATRDGIILLGGVEILLRVLASDFDFSKRAISSGAGGRGGRGESRGAEPAGLLAGVRAAIGGLGGLIGVGGGARDGERDRDDSIGGLGGLIGVGGGARDGDRDRDDDPEGEDGSEEEGSEEALSRSDCHNEVLAILRELCFSVAGFSSTISVHDHLVARLFALMSDKNSFDNAVGLAEELLAVREESYLLSEVPNLPEMLRGFTSLQLAFFCRILALVVFEPEGPGAPDAPQRTQPPGGSKAAAAESSLEALTNPNAVQAERYAEAVAQSAASAVADGSDCSVAVAAANKLEGAHTMGYNAELNHACLLAVPELLPRLVKLLRLKKVPLLEQIFSHMPMPLPPDMVPLTQLLAGLHEHLDGDAAGALEAADGLEGLNLADLSLPRAMGGDGLGAGRGLEGLNLADLPLPRTGPRAGDGGGEDGPLRAGGPLLGGVATAGVDEGAAARAGGDRTPHTPQAPPISLQALTLVTHQVEVLFVLCALLGGKCKQHAQDRLAALGLVSALNSMFNRIDWSVPPPTAPEPHGVHGPGCACNPESALKIQHLRLVHNFCDRDCDNSSNKRLLLLPAPVPGAGDGAEDADEGDAPGAGAAADEGLMGKIVQVLLKEPSDSVYRFWLASCVEAFLRGSDPVTQDFVGGHGLMEHLVEAILEWEEKSPSSSSLQINLDLLGELLKFHPCMLARLNDLLHGRRFEQLVEIVVTRLVDSNVFVRSLLLSLVHLRCGGRAGRPGGRGVGFSQAGEGDGAGAGAGAGRGGSGEASPANGGAEAWRTWSSSCSEEWNLAGAGGGGAGRQAAGSMGEGMGGEIEIGGRLEQFMSRNCLRLLRDLMVVVSVDDMNQDNICVINTALIFFIFSHRSGELARDLAALRALDATITAQAAQAAGSAGGGGGLGSICARPGGACANIRSMLGFWRGYYCSRGRDCLSLEYSSTIPFGEWLDVVEVLCGPPEAPTSLVYSPPAASSSACSALVTVAGPPPRKG